MEGLPEKAIFRSVTVYTCNKILSSQCNFFPQIEQVQDKTNLEDNKNQKLVTRQRVIFVNAVKFDTFYMHTKYTINRKAETNWFVKYSIMCWILKIIYQSYVEYFICYEQYTLFLNVLLCSFVVYVTVVSVIVLYYIPMQFVPILLYSRSWRGVLGRINVIK